LSGSSAAISNAAFSPPVAAATAVNGVAWVENHIKIAADK
jgi:hypothetical protein